MIEAETIAAGLTKAQRAYLTNRAEWRSPASGHPPRWMTFPPANTHRVLCLHGLTDSIGQILTPGLAVRAYLATKEKGDV